MVPGAGSAWSEAVALVFGAGSAWSEAVALVSGAGSDWLVVAEPVLGATGPCTSAAVTAEKLPAVTAAAVTSGKINLYLRLFLPGFIQTSWYAK